MSTQNALNYNMIWKALSKIFSFRYYVISDLFDTFVSTFFVDFFMYTPKQQLNLHSIETFRHKDPKRHESCNLHPQKWNDEHLLQIKW